MSNDSALPPEPHHDASESRQFLQSHRKTKMGGYKKPKAIPVAPGVRRIVNRLQAKIMVNGRMHYRMFPLDTDLETVAAWRQHTKLAHGTRVSPHRRPLPISLRDWCYLYFILQGQAVKIGRATDVRRRVEELQTASALPLTLLVAVAAHKSLEVEFLKRLQPFRLNGEWFIYGRELRVIVSRLCEGMNPVEMLFLWDQVIAPIDPTP